MLDIKYYNENLKNPPYPPYHIGKDLEDYFIEYYFNNKEKFDATGYIFLPIKWTAIYNLHNYLLNDLNKDIQKLDKTQKYFTVSQHDDAPYLKLPPNTLNFAAGGNAQDVIPIPLICSSITEVFENKPKDIFCSFVGSVSPNIGGNNSLSHNIRMKMLEILVNNDKYVLKPKHWEPNIKEDRKDLFLDVTSRSKFTLCPRGYGATSFRMYEAMQLKSVPVYIYYNKPYFPYTKEIDWTKLCVSLDVKDMQNLDNILNSISTEKYTHMINYAQEVYPHYFTLETTCEHIFKFLNNK